MNFRTSYLFTALFVLSTTSLTPANTAHAAAPNCASSQSDVDGDGWGWENNQSCVVSGSTNTSQSNTVQSNGTPDCSSSNSDPDGDGWGWENNASCRVTSSSTGNSNNSNSAQVDTNTSTQPATTSNGTPVCTTTASDDNGDGWGFENGESCIVTSATSNTTSVQGIPSTLAPPPVAAANAGYSNGQPICLTDTSDAGNDGFGYEDGQTCVVVNGVTATRSNPLLNQRSCIPWLEIGYGNYRLQNNTWNDSDVYYDTWSQCIELTGSAGNYVAKWDYNWLDRTEGNEFAVKSYPQVYYGRKNRYNLSGTVAETGLPASVNNLQQFWVDFDFSETGIMERNVALESFFHTSCDAENYNKQYEMMVWVGVPTIRTPGTKLTTVNLSGYEWDVYVNPALGWAYVAFVATTPFNRGTLDWNAFVEWSRFEGPAFGVPSMVSNACMGAIELGTETFWGSGTFTLNEFKVRRQ